MDLVPLTDVVDPFQSWWSDELWPVSGDRCAALWSCTIRWVWNDRDGCHVYEEEGTYGSRYNRHREGHAQVHQGEYETGYREIFNRMTMMAVQEDVQGWTLPIDICSYLR